MKKFFLLTFAALFFANKANAQLLFEELLSPNVNREFYSNVRAIKRISDHRSHTGGRGYWTISRLDSLGRVIEREGGRNRRLFGRQNFVYNASNDILYQIVAFDVNNPNRTNDTISRFEYKYLENRIVYQRLTFGSLQNNFIVTQLVEIEGDSVFVYQERRYFFREGLGEAELMPIRTFILSYRNEQLVSLERIDDNGRRISFLEYYQNGLLKRTRTVTDSGEEIVATGGRWANDVFFEYKFDRFGRIRRIYYIIKGERHRIATYRYCTGGLCCRLNPFAWCR